MKWLARMVLVVLCLAVAGCDEQGFIAHFMPKAESALAKTTLEDLRHGNIDAVKAKLTLKAQSDPTIDAKIKQLAAYFPPGEPSSVTVLSSRINEFNGVRHVQLTYEYHFDTEWVMASVATVKDGNAIYVEGLHVNHGQQSAAQANAFTLRGKSGIFWLMTALAIAVPIFCIVVFVVCVRTPMRGRKWPWCVFVLLGVGSTHLVWATGQFSTNLLSVLFLGGSSMQLGGGPLVISVAFPLGAVIFLLRRRALMLPPPAVVSGRRPEPPPL